MAIPKIYAEEIYKIITELSTNTIKHSKADTLSILFKANSDLFYLETIDNGIGFDPEKLTKKGIGLDSIKTRVELLNGRFSIKSRKEKGSTFTVKLPVQSTSSE